MSPNRKKIVAAILAVALLAPAAWHVGGQWGLAVTLALLVVMANVWGRSRGPNE